jgi:hypothetical protein
LHSVAHAAFGIGCEVYRLQALLTSISDVIAVGRPVLDYEIRLAATFLLDHVGALTPHVNQAAVTNASEFIYKWLGISKISARRKHKARIPQPGIIIGVREAEQWVGIVFELNAAMGGADQRVQRWWRAGSALGLVDLANQSDSDKVLEHLKDAQTSMKLLQKQQGLPYMLNEFAFLDLESDSSTICSKLRRICALSPTASSPVQSPADHHGFDRLEMAKATTLFALAARKELHAMAMQQVRPKLANDARDRAMYELRANGGTLRQAIQLSQDCPDYRPLADETSVQRAIDSYAKRYGLEKIRRDRKQTQAAGQAGKRPPPRKGKS